MTNKEKFLNSLQAKIKAYQDAYDYNKNLPDDLFDSLGGSGGISITAQKPRNGAKKAKANGGEYGANINSVRKIIEQAGTDGIGRQAIVEVFPGAGAIGEKKVYSIVTNSLSSLNKGDEIEKFKPKGKKMRGYYWRTKN